MVKGTSTNCAEMTLVILESAPHKSQNQLQNSLPLTPRLPIEGEPSRCKQEAADSDVTAGHTNSMAEMAKPTKIADVDRTPMLGGEPATRDCGVDKGNRLEHEGKSHLQKTKFYCKEACQCSGNAHGDIPSANRLLLEGE